MPSQRVVTSLAIAFGGVLGSAAALVGGAPEPPPDVGRLPFAPIGRAHGETVARAEPALPPPPRTAVAQAAESVLTTGAQPLTGIDAVKNAELECSRGNGRSCLDAADAHEHARGIDRDPERARMLTGLGVQQFAIRCMDRVPAACLELAKLHKLGRGVAEDAVAANALVDRATMLCRAKPTAPGCPGEQP
jgi:hypothetical protein